MGKYFVLDLGILPPFGRADTVDLERNISLYMIAVQVIGERAKQARHSQVCSIENRGYIYILYIVRANFVLITRKEGGA